MFVRIFGVYCYLTFDFCFDLLVEDVLCFGALFGFGSVLILLFVLLILLPSSVFVLLVVCYCLLLIWLCVVVYNTVNSVVWFFAFFVFCSFEMFVWWWLQGCCIGVCLRVCWWLLIYIYMFIVRFGFSIFVCVLLGCLCLLVWVALYLDVYDVCADCFWLFWCCLVVFY